MHIAHVVLSSGSPVPSTVLLSRSGSGRRLDSKMMGMALHAPSADPETRKLTLLCARAQVSMALQVITVVTVTCHSVRCDAENLCDIVSRGGRGLRLHPRGAGDKCKMCALPQEEAMAAKRQASNLVSPRAFALPNSPAVCKSSLRAAVNYMNMGVVLYVFARMIVGNACLAGGCALAQLEGFGTEPFQLGPCTSHAAWSMQPAGDAIHNDERSSGAFRTAYGTVCCDATAALVLNAEHKLKQQLLDPCTTPMSSG